MNRAFALLALLTVGAAAQDQAAPPKVERYSLKNRSSFNYDTEARPPFWPIGWQKKNYQAGVTNVAAKAAQLQAASFTVSSVLLGEPALAMINGRSYAQGDALPVVYDGQKLNVVVQAIRDGGVVLAYDQSTLFVPIKRSEVAPRSPAPVVTGTNQPPSIIIDSGAGPK